MCIVFQVPQLPQVRNTSAGLVRRRPRSARRRRLLDRRPRSSLPRALPRPLAAKSQTFQAPGERLLRLKWISRLTACLLVLAL